ncbi:MAG: DNA polymerase III subunit delta [Desertifilum sp.]|nr:DNA polymerase III subunit delta [Desertifilum sp.]
MPVYLYWGEDEFALERAVTTLRDSVLDPNWESFNYQQYPPNNSQSAIAALNEAMTPPFGMGSRFVWLVDTPILQTVSDAIIEELERTLPSIPDTAVLLLTCRNKPDGRLKSTKLLQQYAQSIREFSPIPPWKTDLLIHRVKETAKELDVQLTSTAAELLAESIGNNTRQLFSELDKLKLYANGKTVDDSAIVALVSANTQNSLQLAEAIAQGETDRALHLVTALLNRNEPALAILATLVRQFRTWLWVKLMEEAKESDERVIAQAAEVANPKRIYFLRQQVRSRSLLQLRQSLPLLLELEMSLKQGAPEQSTLHAKIIELCQLARQR